MRCVTTIYKKRQKFDRFIEPSYVALLFMYYKIILYDSARNVGSFMLQYFMDADVTICQVKELHHCKRIKKNSRLFVT